MLVIATHVNYGKALEKILGNLGYLKYDISQIVVVIAGSDNNETYLENNIRYIKINTNFYELTAIYGIYLYLDELFSEEKHFLFIQDTCILLQNFNQSYVNYMNKMINSNADVYYASFDKRCNIVGLSSKFIKECGKDYGITADKPLAWDVEENRCDLSFQKQAMKHNLKTIASLIPTQCSQQTLKYDDSDIIRIRVFFETLALIKLVAANGDCNPSWEKRIYP